jgi:AbiV family abortive infection protein
MKQTQPSEWTAVVDDERHSRLLAGARAAYENACSLVVDAKELLAAQRFPRAGALAILAEEEYAKSFVLCVCASDRRWDSAIFQSLTDHGAKQAVSQGMLAYWHWLQTNLRRVAELNRFSLIGVQPALFPSQDEWAKIVETARTSNLKKRQRDKLKWRLLYVDVGREGHVVHRPAVVSMQVASECIDIASTFKAVTELALSDQIPQFASIAV